MHVCPFIAYTEFKTYFSWFHFFDILVCTTNSANKKYPPFMCFASFHIIYEYFVTHPIDGSAQYSIKAMIKSKGAVIMKFTVPDSITAKTAATSIVPIKALLTNPTKSTRQLITVVDEA